jgi:hypothetical protein
MELLQGIIIRNPFRTICVSQVDYTPFEYSKHLLDKRAKLTNKFYKKVLLRNNLIVWSTTIFSSLIAFLGLVAGIHFSKLYLVVSGIGVNLLGISIAMVVLIIGMFVYDKMSDVFPTDSWYININKRKK